MRPQQPKARRVWPWIFGAVVLLSIVIGVIARPFAHDATPGPANGNETPAATVPPPPAAPTLAPSPTSTPSVEGAASWTMPNLVGANLQDAQDAIQTLTDNAIFFTKSHDATGAGRRQILDRDWKVCSQNVRPGTRITTDTAIDFGAAKVDERC